MTGRKIIHIDMDAFFASVEQRDRPELRGKAIAVGGGGERSVVATASYEARQYGIHSAMSMVKAKELCPQLIVVEPRKERYEEVSMQIHKIFSQCTDLIEPLSVDEAFLDVTENKLGIENPVDIALYIKREIFRMLSLTASAGVSYNKLLAKIASDYNKPDGLFVITPEQTEMFISKLSVEKIWGVGQVTAKRMHQLGIYSGMQLRDCSLSMLTREFGKQGRMYYDFVRGIDNRPVSVNRIRKSVGCERTFEKDISRQSAVIIELYHLTQELVERIKEQRFRGCTLTLKVKFNDFKQMTRSITKDKDFVTLEDILPEAKTLILNVEYSSHPIRLLGLTVSGHKEHVRQKGMWRQLMIEFPK
ncbi:MAG: DNA polymerase IV [Bacteroides sp.]|nr:DNA polymerase IV [Roseburia sp.]MCM1346653.1 DNA polymerase IV [Bacteroides sp.]MCM1419917.1 DNA polymerase IV [Bacteroides sp.]